MMRQQNQFSIPANKSYQPSLTAKIEDNGDECIFVKQVTVRKSMNDRPRPFNSWENRQITHEPNRYQDREPQRFHDPRMQYQPRNEPNYGPQHGYDNYPPPMNFPPQQQQPIPYDLVPQNVQKLRPSQETDKLIIRKYCEEIAEKLQAFLDENENQDIRTTMLNKLKDVLDGKEPEIPQGMFVGAQQVVEEEPEEMAEVDIPEIKSLLFRLEVIPDKVKIGRLKYMLRTAPSCSKILVFTNGPKTMDFLTDRLSKEVGDGYDVVKYDDYKYEEFRGQIILLGDRDVEEAKKFPKTAIGFHYSYPKNLSIYQDRCAMFTGKGKRYSVLFFTSRDEPQIPLYKEIQQFHMGEDNEKMNKVQKAIDDGKDDDKIKVYDDCFTEIKEEKFRFVLPRGKPPKINKVITAQTTGDSGGNAAGWGGQSNAGQGWQANAGNTAPDANAGGGWGGGNTAPVENSGGGWGGGNSAPVNNQPQKEDGGWGTDNNNANNEQPVQAANDTWGDATQNQKPKEQIDSWGNPNQGQPEQQEEQITKKVHFEEEKNSFW